MSELKVNGEVVSPVSIEQERQQLINELSLQKQSISNDRLKLMIHDRARQNVIDHFLFKQEAEKRGFEIDQNLVEMQVSQVAERNGGVDALKKYLSELNEDLNDFRKHIKDRMLVDRLVDEIHSKVSIPKDRAAKKFYKENKESYSFPEKVEAEYIVKRFRNPVEKRKAKLEIEKIEAALKAGKSFKLMVKQRSDEPANDGRFGQVERGKLGVVFDNFIFSANEGDISAPIETANGWYLIKVGHKQEAIQQKFDEVKDEIIQGLWEEDKKQALKEVLDKLQKNAVIEE